MRSLWGSVILAPVSASPPKPLTFMVFFLQVFAVDRVSSRLLFRSGISALTPGGEAWLPLQLPILWTVGEGPQPLQPEEGKRLYSNKHLPLHECIELLNTVLLQFEANKASVCPSPPSEQATANGKTFRLLELLFCFRYCPLK
ncbi:unnamed protein product [Dibothriocephalus latus]|uniref:Uncharacterized protein n=1 Tax=Dibothriocephalus latus TaxID=60516 RepID=A0A3P7NT80_DIBLA|nr:unnamed protein product [Dibothriocephalus latus]